MAAHETVALVEPMLPSAGHTTLENLSIDLAAATSALSSRLADPVRDALGTLGRSMNCYYSNLIEGHDTMPRDIDRALRKNYSREPERRKLQLEAVAHIHTQTEIDEGRDPAAAPTTVEYLTWIHREFCSRLPDEWLVVRNPDTGATNVVVPGEFRSHDVIVGRHVPPTAASTLAFMRRFEQAYRFDHLSRVQQIVAVAASHHRLLWIHPFLDGNGRVARLSAHATLKRAGVGSSLWSVARGLARRVTEYRQLLEAADEPRRNDLDGRGTLSEASLVAFCEFFLDVCVDQVRYMTSLIEPSELLRRIQLYVEDEVRAARLPDGAFAVLREALLAGKVERAHARQLTGFRERKGREVVAALLNAGLLTSDGDRAPLRLAFPIDVVERWFPRLYPVA